MELTWREKSRDGGIAVMQMRGSSACERYERFRGTTYAKSNFRVINMERNRRHAYSGRMTPACRKRMAKAITLMVQSAKGTWRVNQKTQRQYLHKLSFVTLTITDGENIPARTAYHLCFKHFLQWLRRTMEVKIYIWKAELQQRGQIHYHVTFPNYIDWQIIRKKWNSLQRDAGLLKDYFAKNHHYDPNSTDIHAVENKDSLDWYLTKELAKTIDSKRLHMKKVVDSLIKAGELFPATEEQYNKIIDEYTGEDIATEGKVWDCSENLSGVKLFDTVMTSEMERRIEAGIRNKTIRKVVGDFWCMYYFRGASPPELLTVEEYRKFEEHVGQVHTYRSKRIRKGEEILATVDLTEIDEPYQYPTWQPAVKDDLLLF